MNLAESEMLIRGLSEAIIEAMRKEEKKSDAVEVLAAIVRELTPVAFDEIYPQSLIDNLKKLDELLPVKV